MAQQNVMQNPYGAPRAMVGDREEFQPVKLLAVSGRIGRARYIVYSMLVSFVLVVPAMALMALSPGLGMAVLAVAYIASFVVSIMLTIQRSHDFNMSGWFSLLMFVPSFTSVSAHRTQPTVGVATPDSPGFGPDAVS